MAETPASTPLENSAPSPAPRQQELWVVAGLAVAALICVSGLAIALVVLLGRSQGASAPIQISNIGNSAPAAVEPAPRTAPAAAAGIQRPYEPAKPQADRVSAMDRSQPALPGVLATPTITSGQRKVALTRADPASPPSPNIEPTPDPRKVFFRVRADAASLYRGEKALPMPVRYNADAQGRVKGVFAAREAAGPDAAKFSYAQDVPFVEAGVRGQSLDVQLGTPRKTAAVDGFRAPKEFQFFTAKLTIANQGTQAVPLSVGNVEVCDTDGVCYLANPELVVGAWPEAPLAPGAQIAAELSFLVPESSPLKELSVQEGPGQSARVPLQAR
jgi:hypothetical protein